MKALLFAAFLVLQSDKAVFVADNNIGSFRKSRIFAQKVKCRCRRPAMASEIYTAYAYCPALLREILKLRLKRRFWCAPRRAGFWESEVCGSWQEVGRMYPDWEDSQYVAYFRMTKGVFFTVCGLYGNFLRRKDTPMRAAIPVEKRMAIVLFWLAHSVSFVSVAGLFCIGKSTAVAIVHSGVHVLRRHMVPSAILFPTGSELDQVLCDFEALCHLPQCAGALDGTFMRIEKPIKFGDSYFCYKRFHSIIILACVDARGIFTSVNSGRPGSVGDSFTYNHSSLKRNIDIGNWLHVSHSKIINGQEIRPFLVADSAFSLSPTVMKCFDEDPMRPHYVSFNYSVIRTRRVVEQAFGRLKGRWRVTAQSKLNDPVFASVVGTVCCGLHNICERYKCPYEDEILPDATDFENGAEDGDPDLLRGGREVRNVISEWVHAHYPR